MKDAPPLQTTHVPILQPDKDVAQHLSLPKADSVIGALSSQCNAHASRHICRRCCGKQRADPCTLYPAHTRLPRSSRGVRHAGIQQCLAVRFHHAVTFLHCLPFCLLLLTVYPRKSTPFVSAPLAPFVTTDFMAWYRTREANKPGADSRIVLMERFLRCPNFALWLSERRSDDEARLRELQAQALRGLSQAMRLRSEVEKIDVLISCQLALKKPSLLPVSVATVQEQMALILEQLPPDLRKSLEKPLL